MRTFRSLIKDITKYLREENDRMDRRHNRVEACRLVVPPEKVRELMALHDQAILDGITHARLRLASYDLWMFVGQLFPDGIPEDHLGMEIDFPDTYTAEIIIYKTKDQGDTPIQYREAA